MTYIYTYIILLSKLTTTDKKTCHIQIGTIFVIVYNSNFRIFSFIEIVEPFLPIVFQKIFQIVSIAKALHNVIINYKKYCDHMKKIFRKIQMGTTKMFKRIKALGSMENETEMCSSTL